MSSELPVKDIVSSAGEGLLFGAVVGYAIKKLMKIAAVVEGLFVVGRPMIDNLIMSNCIYFVVYLANPPI
jgi:uncharacterized membrane protein (Fun14 family)